MVPKQSIWVSAMPAVRHSIIRSFSPGDSGKHFALVTGNWLRACISKYVGIYAQVIT